MTSHRPSNIILLMGVSGSGKTQVGRLLAAGLAARFLDADDLHSEQNVRKMRAGTPLTDMDRRPWLDAVGREMARLAHDHRGLVVACSALKRAYRDCLRASAPALRLIWLSGPTPLIRERLSARVGHFMPTSLLESQLATLEPPGSDERPLVIDITPPPAEIVAELLHVLANRRHEAE